MQREGAPVTLVFASLRGGVYEHHDPDDRGQPETELFTAIITPATFTPRRSYPTGCDIEVLEADMGSVLPVAQRSGWHCTIHNPDPPSQTLEIDFGWETTTAATAALIRLFPDLPFEDPRYWFARGELTPSPDPEAHPYAHIIPELYIIDVHRTHSVLAIRQNLSAPQGRPRPVPYSEALWNAYRMALQHSGLCTEVLVTHYPSRNENFIELVLTDAAAENFEASMHQLIRLLPTI